jgi:hypothetical protein
MAERDIIEIMRELLDNIRIDTRPSSFDEAVIALETRNYGRDGWRSVRGCVRFCYCNSGHRDELLTGSAVLVRGHRRICSKTYAKGRHNPALGFRGRAS